MSTYLPTVFGENLMDVFDDFDRNFFRGWGNVDRELYGKHARHMMKTDVKEVENGYEVDIDLPGFKKDEITLELKDGYLTISAQKSIEKDNEKHGRKIFYGAMIAEGVIGLIWVTLGMSFYSDTAALAAALGPKGNAALVVNNISVELLGVFGGALAVLGVVVLPVTSGDTAFRAARLTIADAIGYDQRPHKNRLMIAVPLFVVGVALNFIPFGMLWRYFGFANQALAAIMLWAAAAYLLHRGKFHWIASVPACFMTAVSAVYICFEKTMGFGMSYELSNIVGIAIALICFALLLTAGRKVQPTDDLSV